ncbi:PREDICTED: syntaxin-6 [Nipponia nippon]|nr:PREDICTED: syntaxin-6 [Nipponia nippon]
MGTALAGGGGRTGWQTKVASPPVSRSQRRGRRALEEAAPEEAAPEAEQRGAHGPTWKGKQCKIKAARGRKQLAVQIIIAEGCAHHRVFRRRFKSAFDGGQRRSAPGSSSGIHAVASWPGAAWAAGAACRLPASPATAAKPRLGSSRPPQPQPTRRRRGWRPYRHSHLARSTAAPTCGGGAEDVVSKILFRQRRLSPSPPPASLSLSPNVRPRPQGEASCSKEVENPPEQLMIIPLLLFNHPGCREVQKAVNTAQGLFQRWTELLQDPSIATREEIDWTTNELRNNLRSIEWDLEDLDETISIVEANPRKFNLDATELGIRKAFITSTRQVVREMKDQMSNSSMQALAERKNRQALLGESGSQSWSSGPDKYSRLDRELQLANSHFIEEQQAQQQLIVEQQDEQLELVSGSIGVLKNMSQRIGGELEEQAVMLDDFSHELDSTQSRLDNVMKKLAKVSHMTSDRRQWCAIIVLFVILLVVLILFFVL